jgi:hypothetical protein
MREEDRLQEQDLHPMRAQNHSEVEDWPGYFAADLAAGEGRDTLELLQQGWRAVATDGHPDATGDPVRD